MKRNEMRIATVVLAGAVVVSGIGFSTRAAQINAFLPTAGVGTVLEQGTSVEELERIGKENGGAGADNIHVTQAVTPTATPAVTSGATQNAQGNTPSVTPTAVPTISQAATPTVTPTPTITPTAAPEEEEPDEYGDLVIAQVDAWVNVRSAPNTDSEILGKLYNNSVGEMIRIEGDWYYITSGTVTGYVKGEYCVTGEEAEELIDEVSVKVARVNADTLNLRSEPSTDGRLLKQIANGKELEVISTDYDGWVEVTYNGTQGYVSADYVTVTISYVSAESKEEEQARLAAERAEREEQERRAAEAAAQAAAEAEAAAQQAAAEAAAQAAAEAAAQAAGQTATSTPVPEAVPTPAPTVSSTYEKGVEVANFALQYVGNPYVYGGTSLTNGADCSGFVLAVYANFGVSLPHSANADRNMGIGVPSLAEAQPGDLVCYSGHVGIYIGNGQIVHASTRRTGIKISDANYKPIICIRRIFY